MRDCNPETVLTHPVARKTYSLRCKRVIQFPTLNSRHPMLKAERMLKYTAILVIRNHRYASLHITRPFRGFGRPKGGWTVSLKYLSFPAPFGAFSLCITSHIPVFLAPALSPQKYKRQNTGISNNSTLIARPGLIPYILGSSRKTC